MAIERIPVGVGDHSRDPRTERARNAARLSAQIVSRCDLLSMEALDLGAPQLQRGLNRISRLSLEMSRLCSTGEADTGTLARLVHGIDEMLVTLDDVQQLNEAAAGLLRGEDLLSLQVSALDLRSIAEPSEHGSPAFSEENGAELPVPDRATILIVDDDESNREILMRLLRSGPWELSSASSGMEALNMAQTQSFDLLMLDVLMPGMDGLSLLRRLRHDARLADLPVIMISGVDQTANVVACLEAGATDYVSKPFNPVLLKARIGTALEHRRMERKVRAQMEEMRSLLTELGEVKASQDRLISALLPPSASDELRLTGAVAPRYHADVTIVFTDFVGFTASSSRFTAYELVEALNAHFTMFDEIVERYGLERLKTIGDAYMYAAGLSSQKASHANDAVLAAMEMLEYTRSCAEEAISWGMRVGVNTGPVVSGVIGKQRLAFDIWGDTVNMASRLVDAAQPEVINLSASTFGRVKELFSCAHRGLQKIKGDRSVEMYSVEGPTFAPDGLSIGMQKELFRERYRRCFGYFPPAVPDSLCRERLQPIAPGAA